MTLWRSGSEQMRPLRRLLQCWSTGGERWGVGGVAVEQDDAKCFMWKWHSLLRMIDK